MAEVLTEVIETPTQDMPFKATISEGGEVIQERYFASRVAAEAFIAETIKGLGVSADRDRRFDGR